MPWIKCKVKMGHREEKKEQPGKQRCWLRATFTRSWSLLFSPGSGGCPSLRESQTLSSVSLHGVEPDWWSLSWSRGRGEPESPGRQGQGMSKRGGKAGTGWVNWP